MRYCRFRSKTDQILAIYYTTSFSQFVAGFSNNANKKLTQLYPNNLLDSNLTVLQPILKRFAYLEKGSSFNEY